MSTKNTEEKRDVLGLDTAADRKEAEYDLVSSLLAAASYQEDEDLIHEAEIKRNGKFLFSVHLRPLSDPDAKYARKKATTYMPNPNGRKYPPIEKEFDATVFNSWIIYLATIEQDREKIWSNPAVMKAHDIKMPVDSIDVLLRIGEKRALAELVMKISGIDDDDDEGAIVSQEEYAKN